MAHYPPVYTKIGDQVKKEYRSVYNQYELKNCALKIECFNQFALLPIEYYQCYDLVEASNFQKRKLQQRRLGEMEDDLILCQADCKTQPQRARCLDNCEEQLMDSVRMLYNTVYELQPPQGPTH